MSLVLLLVLGRQMLTKSSWQDLNWDAYRCQHCMLQYGDICMCMENTLCMGPASQREATFHACVDVFRGTACMCIPSNALRPFTSS